MISRGLWKSFLTNSPKYDISVLEVSMSKSEQPRYWLKTGNEPWREATEGQYITEEASAGFNSKDGGIATAGFSSTSSNTQGRITYKANAQTWKEIDPAFYEILVAPVPSSIASAQP
jgi:hypothetical protein